MSNYRRGRRTKYRNSISAATPLPPSHISYLKIPGKLFWTLLHSPKKHPLGGGCPFLKLRHVKFRHVTTHFKHLINLNISVNKVFLCNRKWWPLMFWKGLVLFLFYWLSSLIIKKRVNHFWNVLQIFLVLMDQTFNV